MPVKAYTSGLHRPRQQAFGTLLAPPKRGPAVQHWVTYPLLTHPLNPELVTGHGIAPLRPGRRGRRVRRHRLHRPPRAVAQVAHRRRPRRPRSVRRAVVRRRRHRAHPADPQHRGAALPQPVHGGQGGGDDRRPERRAVRALGRHRLPPQRVPGPRRRLRAAQRAVRRGAGRAPRRVDHRRVRLRGQRLHRRRGDGEPEAGARADLDRRQQRRSPGGGSPSTATAGTRSRRRRRWPRRPARRSLEDLDDLAPMVDHLRRHAEAAGRDPASIDIAFTTGEPGPADDGFDAAAHLDALEPHGRPRRDLELDQRPRRLPRPRRSRPSSATAPRSSASSRRVDQMYMPPLTPSTWPVM